MGSALAWEACSAQRMLLTRGRLHNRFQLRACPPPTMHRRHRREPARPAGGPAAHPPRAPRARPHPGADCLLLWCATPLDEGGVPEHCALGPYWAPARTMQCVGTMLHRPLPWQRRMRFTPRPTVSVPCPARLPPQQEVIIQNFRRKQGTAMAGAPEPPLAELLWTVAVARLLLGAEVRLAVGTGAQAGCHAAAVAAAAAACLRSMIHCMIAARRLQLFSFHCRLASRRRPT